jgi:hypothetical protein
MNDDEKRLMIERVSMIKTDFQIFYRMNFRHLN